MNFLLTKEIYGPIITILSAILLYIVLKNTFTSAIKRMSGEYRKQKTILNLIKNILKYVLIVIVILIILGIYGIDTNSILAGFGIIGVVVGFALQDILKDFFAGITIIIDNQYSIGDNVLINNFRGDVISLGLRSTKLKNEYGEIRIISNRNILEVTNYSLNNSIIILELNVGYDEDEKTTEKILDKCILEINDLNDVIKNTKLLGIDSLNETTITYKLTIECKTMKHLNVKRQVSKILKSSFDEKKIKIFYRQ